MTKPTKNNAKGFKKIHSAIGEVFTPQPSSTLTSSARHILGSTKSLVISSDAEHDHPDITSARSENIYNNTTMTTHHLNRLKTQTSQVCNFVDTKFLSWRSGKESDVYSEVMYRKIKGDQMCQLAMSLGENAMGAVIEDFEEVVNKGLDMYEEAIDMGENVLLPTNSLKVLLTLKMSIALHDLCGHSLDAWVCAKRTLLRAEKYQGLSATALDESETEMLQRLRDFVSMLETYLSHHKHNSETKSDRKMCNLAELEQEENDDGNRNAGQFEHFNMKRRQSQLQGATSLTLSLAHKVELMKRGFRLDDGEEYLLLGNLNHASQLMGTLRKIFNSYVRGNAVHASTQSGTSAALDGVELDMDDFLLGGPYLSWEGFSFFCHDFNITPRRDGKGNRKMNIRAGESFLFNDNMEVQMIFTMTSIAPQEVLKVKNGVREWSKGARDMWRDATKIADASVHPTAGLNFDNFCDCIARLGLVGLCRGTWAEMFPSTTERVEAIFLTTMGCLDNSLVTANLHQHKKSQGLATSEYKGMTALTREHSLKGFEESKRKAKQDRVRRRSSSAPLHYTVANHRRGSALLQERDDE
ncbi:hypothetical protein TrLO_g14891 [Triparma laevis f. longispina]|uniref:14-3-3 domain-containing protein n=1 Tax=Triparma laevis f. longispina TaxID=1714387 RepID=A0A9W7FUK1_9STRA|nr:hypothetical protein TrLO_g14891 [Triparma laevis f. longispina]